MVWRRLDSSDFIARFTALARPVDALAFGTSNRDAGWRVVCVPECDNINRLNDQHTKHVLVLKGAELTDHPSALSAWVLLPTKTSMLSRIAEVS